LAGKVTTGLLLSSRQGITNPLVANTQEGRPKATFYHQIDSILGFGGSGGI
jgi:hypothetical protein